MLRVTALAAFSICFAASAPVTEDGKRKLATPTLCGEKNKCPNDQFCDMVKRGNGPQCRSCLAENGSKMSSCCAIYESLGGATSAEAEAIKGGIGMCDQVCQPRHKSRIAFQSGDEEGETRWACRVAGGDDSSDDDDGDQGSGTPSGAPDDDSNDADGRDSSSDDSFDGSISPSPTPTPFDGSIRPSPSPTPSNTLPLYEYDTSYGINGADICPVDLNTVTRRKLVLVGDEISMVGEPICLDRCNVQLLGRYSKVADAGSWDGSNDNEVADVGSWNLAVNPNLNAADTLMMTLEPSMGTAFPGIGCGKRRFLGQESIERQHKRGRTLVLDAAWEHQLNVAATEVADTQARAEESVVVFYQNYSSAAQMKQSMEEMRARVKGVVHEPADTLNEGWRKAAHVNLSAVPDGVMALKQAGIDAVKDVEVVQLTRAEVLVSCHVTAAKRADGSVNYGYCHSPPTSSTVWATRTEATDGRTILLLWTCHVYDKDDVMAAHAHAPCHVNAHVVLALAPAHKHLLESELLPPAPAHNVK